MRKNDLPKLVKKLGALDKFFRDLPKVIGNAYVNFALDNFKTESWEGTPWPTRKDPERRKDRRALLVKTGALRRSIHYKLQRRQGGTAIIVSSNVPYAEVHNEGQTLNLQVKVKQHDRRTKKGTVKVKAHQRQVTLTMPERRFIGPSKTFERDITNYIIQALNKLL